MSMVIVGGNDRMVCQYKKIYKKHRCKVKVFTQMPANLGNQIGSADLIILFTNTVSHKMVRCAVSEKGRVSINWKKCLKGKWNQMKTEALSQKYNIAVT